MFLIQLLACSETNLSTVRDGTLLVSPAEYDFGDVEFDADAVYSTFTAKNVGDLTLYLDHNFIDNNYFQVHDFPSELSGGESVEFTISFNPDGDGYFSNQLSVEHHNETSVVVDVTGNGLAPELTISPEQQTVSSDVLCYSNLPVTFKNTGSMDLSIYDLDILTSFPSSIDIDTNQLPIQFPFVLAPDQSFSAYVTSENDDFYDDELFIEVESNDPVDPVKSSEITFSVNPGVEKQDLFVQKISSSADVLFVVDNSGSMSDEQQNLSNNLNNFISEFIINNIDFQIGVITTDSPGLRGQVINNNTPNIEDEFKAQVSVGITGSAIETGIHQAYLATLDPVLSSNSDNGQALSLIRQDSVFSIVFITDELDSSPMSDYGYKNHFASLNSSNVLFHSIISPPPYGCGNLAVNNRLASYSSYSGASIMSICSSDWGYDLENVAKQSYLRSSFYLSEPALNGSVRVFVDGQENWGWTYNSNLNAVVFNSNSIPADQQSIEINYILLQECK